MTKAKKAGLRVLKTLRDMNKSGDKTGNVHEETRVAGKILKKNMPKKGHIIFTTKGKQE